MIQQSSHSLDDVAAQLNVEPIEIRRLTALGFITSYKIAGVENFLHADFVAAIPNLGNAPAGIKRRGNWFEPSAIPNAKLPYGNAVKQSAKNQRLSAGEIAARTNERSISFSIRLQFSPEIREAVNASFIGKSRQRIRRSIGKPNPNYEPETLKEAYAAHCLVNLVSEATGSGLKKLYESAATFTAMRDQAVSGFMEKSAQFSESIPLPGRFGNPPLVIYDLPNSDVFNRTEVQEIVERIF